MRTRLQFAAVGLVVLAAVCIIAWHLINAVSPVSVSAAVHAFRSAHSTTDIPDGPTPGVYTYRTVGSESISAGFSHAYPKVTTLTVIGTSCGMQVRWDILRERWMQGQLCRTAAGWQLQGYTDYHQFLTVSNRLDYTCATSARQTTASATGMLALDCTTPSGPIRITIATVGKEPITVGDKAVESTHYRVTTHESGAYGNNGTDDLWLDNRGLPLKVTVVNHGTQSRVGVQIRYDEHVTSSLTSLVPQR